ncbi:Putative ribosomal N-acetyltransferase YdaF [Vibrio aerogenes CECT 7868]|uniref:Putative ribosomal N-acetyltransferase YdaF n=1 Tax=Vibrio aerogenes CECT 7868 TaxID=1216006 RepID=A0A1M5XPX7_9VIBR|nr:ribosomal protein S5-alanine N-acetyltransferase [Vibrio aerogenes]SHI01895.1 Putative ribosomal N-acetyltransferase YdaF [Vibrio aerogenes CECT 7868]
MQNHIYDVDDDIVIRTARVDDARMITKYFCHNKEFLRPWEPQREPGFFEHKGWTQKLMKLEELRQLGLGYYILILDMPSNQMLGTISFSQMTRFPLYGCFVGYSLAEDAQGKGVMTRALKMACRYMFQVQKLHRISATYMPFNHRSEAVLKRVGFEYEGTAKDYLLINGKWQDHHITSLINQDWEAGS